MFKYTRASIDLIIRDIKKYYRIFRFISFIVMLSYFVFAAITGLGVLWVNIALASLLVVYEVTSQFITSKKTKKYLRRSYNWLKFIVRAVSLGFIIYGIYEAAEKALEEGSKKILLNFTESPVINSQGIAQLIELAEIIVDEKGGDLAFCGLSELSTSVFKMVGLLQMGDAYENEKDALNYLASSTINHYNST